MDESDNVAEGGREAVSAPVRPLSRAQARVNYEVACNDLKYYVFDWDDNILHMPTCIHLEHCDENGTWRPVKVSTSVFAVARTDTAHFRAPLEGGWSAAFRDFQDEPDAEVGNSRFLADTNLALDRILLGGEKPGPSFETLRKTLREGRIFAIVTARGHAQETIREAVKIFIDRALTASEKSEMMANLRGYRWWLDRRTEFGTDEEELDYYLSMCRYRAVTSPDFRALMEGDRDFHDRLSELGPRDARRPELAKQFAIRDFVEHLFGILERTGGPDRPVSVGFSDDDPRNVAAVADYVRAELSKRFGAFKFVVYDTSDPTLSNGRKVTVAAGPGARAQIRGEGA